MLLHPFILSNANFFFFFTQKTSYDMRISDWSSDVCSSDLLMWQPPVAWFADPHLSLPTPITITDDGRIYGHAAQWGSCHIGQEGVCVQPPHEEIGRASCRERV